MPAFISPFQGNIDRKLGKGELIQTLYLDIADELEVIHPYNAHVQATDIEIAKKIPTGIHDEEKAHIGELMMLLRALDPQEAELLTSGEVGAREMLSELGIAVPEDKSGSGFPTSTTVDSPFDKPRTYR